LVNILVDAIFENAILFSKFQFSYGVGIHLLYEFLDKVILYPSFNKSESNTLFLDVASKFFNGKNDSGIDNVPKSE
jgi:hypothetical protein